MNDVPNKEPELQADTLELINAELIGRLSRQAEAGARIDTKAALLVGYAAAAAAFLATRHSQPVLTWLAFAAFAVSAGFGIAAYAVSAYTETPTPRHLFNQYARQPKTATLAALAARRVGVYESNIRWAQRKARRWWMSLTALMAGIALMLGALYVHTDSHGRSTARHRPASRGTAATGGAGAAARSR